MAELVLDTAEIQMITESLRKISGGELCSQSEALKIEERLALSPHPEILSHNQVRQVVAALFLDESIKGQNVYKLVVKILQAQIIT